MRAASTLPPSSCFFSSSRTIAQAPSARQLLALCGIKVVQPVAYLGPSRKALLQLDLVRPRRPDQDCKIASPGALSDGLGVQERRYNGLLDLPKLQADRLL